MAELGTLQEQHSFRDIKETRKEKMRVNGITPTPTDNPRIFALPSMPNPPESLQLFRNGVLQDPGEQFELTGAQIQYSFDVKADWQRAWYEAEKR